MENLNYLILLLTFGKLTHKIPAFPQNTPHVLNQYVIYISFPAMVLLKTDDIRLNSELLVPAFMPWFVVILTLFTIPLLSRLFEWDRKLTGAMMLICALGNTSFYGFPAVEAFYGKEYLFYAIIYDQVGSFLALSIFGTIVTSYYGSSSQVTIKTILKKIITFPPFIALLTGIFISHLTKPDFLTGILTKLAATLVPIVTVSVGSQLKFRQPATHITPLLISILYKMIISPFIVLAFLLLIGFQGMGLKITIFEAAMPSMVMAGVIASSSDLKPEFANAVIGYGILVSFVTLPFFYWILGMV